MAPEKIVLLTVLGLLIGAWLTAALVIFAKALREPGGALLNIGENSAPQWRRIAKGLKRAPLVLLLAAGLVVNAVVFVVGACWYCVRGKPMPPAPVATRRSKR